MLWLGLGLLAAFVVLLRLALPREGEVSFVSATETGTAVFSVLMAGMFVVGIALIFVG